MVDSLIKHTVLVECGSASCSGIIVSTRHGYILTHSSIALSYLLEHNNISRQLLIAGHLPYDACEKIGHIAVSCERLTSGVVCNKINSLSTSCNTSNSDRNVFKVTGRICKIWFVESFKKTASSLLTSAEKWSLVEEPANTESKDGEKSGDKASDSQSANYALLFLPCFVLVSVGDALSELRTSAAAEVSQRPLVIGQTVYAVATPFGSLSPAVFLNSISKGIVSNVVGSDSELILTDARCIPGTEGGAIYADSSCSTFPVGIVVAPLCWKAGEWIGMSIVCRTKIVLNSLRDVLRLDEQLLEAAPLNENGVEWMRDIGVVMVRTANGSWGSGVVVDWSKGLVLTCSHVVKTLHEVTVHTFTPVARQFTADVVAATDNAQVYDLALLRLRKFDKSGAGVLIDTRPKEGDAVYIMGHAAWGMKYGLKASLTSGVISKIVYRDDSPVLIQTSCCVNAGASGGPLLSQSGALLGVAVCNARDMVTGAWYPHVNLCVPAAVLWPPIMAYLNTGNKDSLRRDFTASNSAIQQLWLLQLENTRMTTSKL